MDNAIKANLENILKNAVELINVDDVVIEAQIPKGLKVLNLEATVLFVDIRGSSLLSERVGIKLMTKVYHMFSKIVAKAVMDNHGRIVQFAGDGFMAAFTNEGGKTSGVNALNATVDIFNLIKDTYKKVVEEKLWFDCGYGLSHGHIYMTRVKAKALKLQSFGIFPGNATNFASKICDLAEPNQVIMDDDVYQMTKLTSANLQKYKEKVVWAWDLK